MKENCIHYLIGDATRPAVTGNKIVAHVCNDIGAWGAGFVLALSKRWSQPKSEYIREKREHDLTLGSVGLVKVEQDIWVANMIAQHDIRFHDGVPPIRYEALRKCLTSVASWALEHQATIHMPRIGCGLAGS